MNAAPVGAGEAEDFPRGVSVDGFGAIAKWSPASGLVAAAGARDDRQVVTVAVLPSLKLTTSTDRGFFLPLLLSTLEAHECVPLAGAGAAVSCPYRVVLSGSMCSPLPQSGGLIRSLSAPIRGSGSTRLRPTSRPGSVRSGPPAAAHRSTARRIRLPCPKGTRGAYAACGELWPGPAGPRAWLHGDRPLDVRGPGVIGGMKSLPAPAASLAAKVEVAE